MGNPEGRELLSTSDTDEKSAMQLQEDYFFYVWDEEKSEVRWMTSFDTTEEDVLAFSKLLKEKAG